MPKTVSKWGISDRQRFLDHPEENTFIRAPFEDEAHMSALCGTPMQRDAWALAAVEAATQPGRALAVAVLNVRDGFRLRFPVVISVDGVFPVRHYLEGRVCEARSDSDLKEWFLALLGEAKDPQVQVDEERREFHADSESCAKCRSPFKSPTVTYVYPHPRGGPAYLCRRCGEKRARRGQQIEGMSIYMPEDADPNDPRLAECLAYLRKQGVGYSDRN